MFLMFLTVAKVPTIRKYSLGFLEVHWEAVGN